MNPQTEILSVLTIGIVWIGVFWLTYFPSRTLANKKGKAYVLPLALNMLLGIYIFLVVQPRLLNAIQINSQTLNILAIIMTLSLIIHHITVEAEMYFRKSKKLKLIHHLLSHLVFFSAFGISSLIIGLKLWEKSLPSEMSIIGVYLFITLLSSVVGILVGVNKIKLSYN